MGAGELQALFAGLGVGVTLLIPAAGFAMRLERRLTRLESAVRHRLHVDIDLSGPMPFA